MFVIKNTKAMLFLSETDSHPPDRSWKRWDECDIIIIMDAAVKIQDFIFDNKIKDGIPQTVVVSMVKRNDNDIPVFYAVIGKDATGDIFNVVPLNTSRADETTVHRNDVLINF